MYNTIFITVTNSKVFQNRLSIIGTLTYNSQGENEGSVQTSRGPEYGDLILPGCLNWALLPILILPLSIYRLDKFENLYKNKRSVEVKKESSRKRKTTVVN